MAGALHGNEIRPEPGFTGAQRFNPPENSCVECHTGNPNSGPGSVQLRLNGAAPTTYAAGTAIPIQIVITDTGGGRQRWGFELSARFANGTQAGTLTASGSNTTTQRGLFGAQAQVTYASHLNAVRQPGTTFTYTINWTAPAAGSGPVIFNVAANAANGDSTNSGDRIYTAEVVVEPAASSGPTPQVTSAGIVNAATFNAAPNNQIARGQLMSIFGTDLTSGGPFGATSLPLPTQLGSTEVRVNGTPVPLIIVASSQINAQLPFELDDTGTATLTVVSGGASSAQATVNLRPTSPGIFTVNSQGNGDGAILHADNSLVTTANPARAGETVVIFCTGLGATQDPVVSGRPANGERTTNIPTVTIGGANARVDFSGLAPGFVGLYQVNAVVPSGVTGRAAIVITSAGNASRSDVTLPVQ
jgi:uncharacterized protein (TIGR03437 family)